MSFPDLQRRSEEAKPKDTDDRMSSDAMRRNETLKQFEEQDIKSRYDESNEERPGEGNKSVVSHHTFYEMTHHQGKQSRDEGSFFLNKELSMPPTRLGSGKSGLGRSGKRVSEARRRERARREALSCSFNN